jgi:hypothetical protein
MDASDGRMFEFKGVGGAGTLEQGYSNRVTPERQAIAYDRTARRWEHAAAIVHSPTPSETKREIRTVRHDSNLHKGGSV